MNPWTYLEVEKRERLSAKDVLPTTLTGVSSVLLKSGNGKTTLTPTFPSLFTPINQPFRRHQTMFYGFNNAGNFQHLDAQDINLKFLKFINESEKVTDKSELTMIQSRAFYMEKYAPQDSVKSGVIFFLYLGKPYFLNKIKNELSIHMLPEDFNDPNNSQLKDLFLRASGILSNDVRFYNTNEYMQDGGIFTNIVNTDIMYATYKAALNSLFKKTEDNLYQLFLSHPYYIGAAIINGNPGEFFYHILGVVHAAISLIIDPLVELTALFTRSIFSEKPDKAEELFSARLQFGN